MHSTTSLPAAIPLRFQYLRGDQGYTAEQLHPVCQAFTSGQIDDSATALLQLSSRCTDRPVLAARSRIHAALLLIDAGQAASAWQSVQQGLRTLGTLHPSESSATALRPEEWLVMASSALAFGDTETAQLWGRRAIRTIHNKHGRSGYAARSMDDLCRCADAFSVMGAIQLRTGQAVTALPLFENAFQMHTRAGDTETSLCDLLWLAEAERILEREIPAQATLQLVQELIQHPISGNAVGRLRLFQSHCQTITHSLTSLNTAHTWN